MESTKHDIFTCQWKDNEKDIKDCLYRRSCSSHEIEDLMQEIAIIAYSKLHTLEKDFGPWVIGITINVYRDYVKRRVRQRDRENSFAIDMSELDKRPNPEDQAIAREYVRTILDELKPLPRKCCKFHLIEGLTLEKTAEKLEKPTSTVHYHIESAMKQIRKKYGFQLNNVNKVIKDG